MEKLKRGDLESQLNVEVAIMKKMRGSDHVLPVMGYGILPSLTPRIGWIVMPLLDQNLQQLQDSMPHKLFSPATAYRLAIQVRFFNGIILPDAVIKIR